MNICDAPKGNKKHVQTRKNRLQINDAKCAGCGGDNFEYTLEDRHLCFDCYRAEKFYWAKGVDTSL